MVTRASGSATVSFGLVSVPVRVYPASAQAAEKISFNMLHRGCGSRIKTQYLCAKEETVIGRDETVKGYEYAKDQYVIFTAEELKAFGEESTKTIEVTEFVPVASVDPVFYDKPYYLSPDKGGAKGYKLLAEVMKETGRVALGTYASRGKQLLVMLRPANGGLVMQQLLYANEVRPFAEVPIENAEVKEGELKLARLLVEQNASERFQPEKYRDVVRDRVQEALDRKIAGGTFVIAEAVKATTEATNLMAALEASLKAKAEKKKAEVA